MSRVTSNHFSLKYEAAVDNLYDYLMDMDLDVMCEELGVTQEMIVDRFKDKVYNYYQHVDRGIEDALAKEFEDDENDLQVNKGRSVEDYSDDEDEY